MTREPNPNWEIMCFKDSLADLILGPPYRGDPEHDPPIVKKIITVDWSPWFYVETTRGPEFLILIKPVKRHPPFSLWDRIRRFLMGSKTRPLIIRK